MSEKKLFIYQNITLYNILHELEETTKYKIYFVDNSSLKNNFKDINNCLLLTNSKIENINNQFRLENLPISFNKLLENINIHFLKQNFKNQSKINIGKFIIDINSRRLILKDDHINLTEKEIINYVDIENPINAAGAYKFESLGCNLFSYVNGSSHTVRGMPLLPLLNALRDLKIIDLE